MAMFMPLAVADLALLARQAAISDRGGDGPDGGSGRTSFSSLQTSMWMRIFLGLLPYAPLRPYDLPVSLSSNDVNLRPS